MDDRLQDGIVADEIDDARTELQKELQAFYDRAYQKGFEAGQRQAQELIKKKEEVKDE